MHEQPSLGSTTGYQSTSVASVNEEIQMDEGNEETKHEDNRQIEQENDETVTHRRAAMRATKALMVKMTEKRNGLASVTLSQIALAVKSQPEKRKNIFKRNYLASELYTRLLICYGYSNDEMHLFFQNPILNQIFRDNVEAIKKGYKVQANKRNGPPLTHDQKEEKLRQYKQQVDELLAIADTYRPRNAPLALR